MSDFVTIARFDNTFQTELALAKDTLKKAGIIYLCISVPTPTAIEFGINPFGIFPICILLCLFQNETKQLF